MNATPSANPLPRRAVLVSALALPLGLGAQGTQGAQDANLMATRLRTGGCVLLLRHAQTVAGVGDPPGFKIDMCSTQRNLSGAGRAQARRIGLWFSTRGLKPRAVQSSAWCRCKDTADLAFGRHLVWPALNSFFDGRSSEPAQTALLREALAGLAPGQFEVWVTHQVNITALTGEAPAMGEGFALDARGTMVARSTFG